MRNTNILMLLLNIIILTSIGAVQNVFAASNEGAHPSSTVTIPIDEYLKLRQLSEVQKISVLQSIDLSGEYKKILQLKVKGQALGIAPKDMPLIAINENFELSGCQGGAVLFQDADGFLHLTPTNSNFDFTCQINVRDWSNVELSFAPTLHLQASIKNADALISSNGSAGRIVRVTPVLIASPVEQKQETTITGYYRITYNLEDAQFNYRLVANNPSRGVQDYTINLVNGESVQKVTFTGVYKEIDKQIKFSLPPGVSQIVLMGKYVADKFSPIIVSRSQFLLIESDPHIQVVVESTQTRRITPVEAKINPTYPNARAYLLNDKTELSWKANKLEMFTSTGYAVNRAAYRYYVPREGRPIVEAEFTIDNQGTPEIALDVPGDATFLQVNGQSESLFKNKENKLLLQLPQGQQQVLVQYQPKLSVPSLGVLIRPEVVRPGVMMSNVTFNVLLPYSWSTLLGKGFGRLNNDWEGSDIIISILAFMLVFKLLQLMGLETLSVKMGALSMALVCLVNNTYFWGLLWFVGIGWLIRIRSKIIDNIKSARPMKMAFLVVGILGVGYFSILMMSSFVDRMAMKVSSTDSYELNKGAQSFGRMNQKLMSPEMDAAPAAPAEVMVGSEEPEGAVGGEPVERESGGFVGVPAPLKIPNNLRWKSFEVESIEKDRDVNVTLLLMNNNITNIIMLVFVSIIALILWRSRQTILSWLDLASFVK